MRNLEISHTFSLVASLEFGDWRNGERDSLDLVAKFGRYLATRKGAHRRNPAIFYSGEDDTLLTVRLLSRALHLVVQRRIAIASPDDAADLLHRQSPPFDLVILATFPPTAHRIATRLCRRLGLSANLPYLHPGDAVRIENFSSVYVQAGMRATSL